MKTTMIWVLVCVVALGSAEVIENIPCDKGREANILSDISEISVDPCPEAENGEPCNLYRGSNATVTIKFTPRQDASQKVASTIAWVKSGRDLTFRGMRPDACLYMDCPLKANEEKVFSATLVLGQDLPPGLYPLKVKLEERRGRKRVFACHLFSIRLTDRPEGEQ